LDFQLTSEQRRLQDKCRELATNFAARASIYDRDASHPAENYDRLREHGFLALTVGKEWGAFGASFFDHTLAYEVLAQGYPSTALAFNMHTSVVMPRYCQVNLQCAKRARPRMHDHAAATASRRLGSEDPERRARDEMALKIEGVVDSGMNAEKTLCGASRL